MVISMAASAAMLAVAAAGYGLSRLFALYHAPNHQSHNRQKRNSYCRCSHMPSKVFPTAQLEIINIIYIYAVSIR